MPTAWEKGREELIETFKGDAWAWEKWRRMPALVAKDGSRITFYAGQEYDPTQFDLVLDGWGHDHCELCFKTITDFIRQGGRAPVVDEGYTNGSDWVCCECFLKYLAGDRERQDGP